MSPNIRDVLPFTLALTQTRSIRSVCRLFEKGMNEFSPEFTFSVCTGDEVPLGDSVYPLETPRGTYGGVGVQGHLEPTPEDQSFIRNCVNLLAVLLEKRIQEERLEEAHRDLEAQFVRFAENAGDVLYRLRVPTLTYEFISPSCEELFGIPQDDFYRTPDVLTGSVHPESREEWEAACATRKLGDPPLVIEFRLSLPAGAVRWIQLRETVVADPQGNGLFIEGIARDVTEYVSRNEELLAVHESLRQREAMLNSIFRAAPVGIGIVKKRVIGWTNDKIEEMTGYSREELEGSLSRMLYPADDDYEYVGREKYRQIKSAGTGTVETRWRRKDGTIIDVLLSSTPLDLNDQSSWVTFSALDITDRKQLEQQLRQSDKMRAVGQLAGGIAHDFNNQLAGILGYSDLMRELVTENPVLMRYTENIITSTNRAADLTKQLLSFARKGQVFRELIDINSIVDELVSILERTVDRRIDIEKNLAPIPATIRGDASEVQNALLNLAINARDAMPQGGSLRISVAVFGAEHEEMGDSEAIMQEPDSYVEVTVTDTGIGMDAETLSHIFEPFFTTKAPGAGTGMGLSAVYGTVRSLGGTVRAESTPGNGAKFILIIPYEDEPGQEKEDVSLPEQQLNGPKARILLLDDEEQVCCLAADMLRKMGHEVTVFTAARKALEAYEREWESIDLVLLDMIMPVMNGIEVIKEMKKMNPGVKIVILSGFSQNTDFVGETSVCGFLRKPFRTSQLAKVVNVALE